MKMAHLPMVELHVCYHSMTELKLNISPELINSGPGGLVRRDSATYNDLFLSILAEVIVPTKKKPTIFPEDGRSWSLRIVSGLFYQVSSKLLTSPLKSLYLCSGTTETFQSAVCQYTGLLDIHNVRLREGGPFVWHKLACS